MRWDMVWSFNSRSQQWGRVFCYTPPSRPLDTMLNMPRRKKTKIGVISRYFETVASEAFSEADARDIPVFTYCFRIWDRVTICAVLNEDASDESSVVLDGLRIMSQKIFKEPVCLIVRKDAKEFSWTKAEERVVELLSQEGGRAE